MSKVRIIRFDGGAVDDDAIERGKKSGAEKQRRYHGEHNHEDA